MIGSLTGRLVERDPAEILVEVGGVGYRVAVPLTTFGRLPAAGGTVALSVHTHVREDSLVLYGFDTRRERDLFERLIAVPGIGPRLALALLSHIDPSELVEAVRARDTARLSRVPGIGPRTAERLVVELTGALKRLSDLGLPSSQRADRGPRADLESALENLGYRPAQIGSAVDAVLSEADGASLESLLKEVLRRLAAPGRARPAAPPPEAEAGASAGTPPRGDRRHA